MDAFYRKTSTIPKRANGLDSRKAIHLKNLWSFVIMLICRDCINQILALFFTLPWECLCLRISRIFVYGECMAEVCERNRIGAGNPANWLLNSWRTKETGFCSFDQAITGAIYFTFHEWKKSSFDRPNHTSIHVFHFKISVKTKRRKQIRFDKKIVFS